MFGRISSLGGNCFDLVTEHRQDQSTEKKEKYPLLEDWNSNSILAP